MTTSNINTDGLTKMQTIDALNFLTFLLDKSQFKNAKNIFTGFFSAIVDKKNPMMTKVTLLVQTFDGEDENGKYFILTQDRATAFGSSNGIRLEETDRDSWLMEAHFIKRFNELV